MPKSEIFAALSDLCTLQKTRFSTVLKIAIGADVPVFDIASARRDRDVGGLAHIIVRTVYGDAVYRAARRELFRR